MYILFYIHYILYSIFTIYTKNGGTVTSTNIAIMGKPGAPKEWSL